MEFLASRILNNSSFQKSRFFKNGRPKKSKSWFLKLKFAVISRSLEITQKVPSLEPGIHGPPVLLGPPFKKFLGQCLVRGS